MKSALYSRAEPERAARVRLMGALAIGVVAGFWFAQPAVAADDTEPVVPLPLPPGLLAGTTPLPDPTQVQPEDLEPVVSVTQTEDGDLNVTVRVLSPGDDGPATQGDSLSTVISNAPAADITDDLDAPDPDAATPSREPAGGTNTNVSVRVLSPGDNGAVDQDTASVPVGAGGEESDPSSSSSADRPLGSTPRSSSSGDDQVSPERDSAQYQEDNFQYQSSSQSSSDQWTWLWNLTLDCSGNAASTSTESGSESSLNWAWNWMWDWGCDHTEGSVLGDINPSTEPGPADAAGSQGNASTIPSTSSPTGSSLAPAPAQSQLASGMWVWTWTFTHCGRTTSLSTTTSSQTPLTWAWDWMWTWVCPAAGEGNTTVTPPANDAASATMPGVLQPTLPEPSAQVLPPAAIPDLPFLPSLPAVFAAPFVPLAQATITVILPKQLVPTWTLEIWGPPATVAPTIGITGLTQSSARPAAKAATEAPRQGPATDPGGPRSVAVPQPTSVPVRQHSRSRSADQRARPTHEARPQAAPRGKARDRSSLFDHPRRLQGAGSAGTSGGVAPSGLNVVSAALTGLFIFAAPEPGRRIRVARGLSPRSRHRSPIDHPG